MPSTTHWSAYDGRSRRPRAEAFRAVCACGWHGAAEYPVDRDAAGDRPRYAADVVRAETREDRCRQGTGTEPGVRALLTERPDSSPEHPRTRHAPYVTRPESPDTASARDPQLTLRWGADRSQQRASVPLFRVDLSPTNQPSVFVPSIRA
ncbi:hypothetical protein GCM10010343_12310 [Streptomyces avidinii]|uniref:Uncharacterized protein n=1 Tax=Streptomyces avidinii TaxID=1895 RepID=A0ABS4KZF7_STRAV|nr:hypothetical protein [Streptomyces avidinii]GGY88690.1 hypothetical protein GCM10010343_12310 [Streptomyces avidinii]